MAYAVAPCQSSKDFSGKDSDATPIDGFAATTVYCLRGDCLPHVSDLSFSYRSLCGILHAAFGTVRLGAWRENADIDMDKRTHAYQAKRAGHDYPVRRDRLHGFAVCGLSAPARMEAWLYRIYGLLYWCECDFECMQLPVAQENGNGAIRCFVTSSDLSCAVIVNR